MKCSQENVIFLRQLKQLHSQHRAMGQIEWFTPFMVQERHHLPLLLRFGKPAEVFNGNFNSKAGRDDLYRLSLLFSKMGAQALMPVYDRLDSALQCVHIQSAA